MKHKYSAIKFQFEKKFRDFHVFNIVLASLQRFNQKNYFK